MNSAHTLRRTLKPRAGGVSGVPLMIVAAVVGVLAIGGGVGYAVESNHNHESSAAPVGLAAIVPPLSSFTGVSAVTPLGAKKKHSKHAVVPVAHASPAVSPTPGEMPSAAPSLQPVNGKIVAPKRPAHKLRQTAQADSTFDPAAATQAAVPDAVPTQEPVQAAVTPPPAAPVTQATPIYEPAVVVEARFVSQVQPIYPEIARNQGIQGTTIVLVTVGPSGNVISQSIGQSAGNRLLDGAALDAARASRFQAPEVDGHPATQTYRVVYTFSL